MNNESFEEKSPTASSTGVKIDGDGNNGNGNEGALPSVMGGSAPSFMQQEFDNHNNNATQMQRRPPSPCLAAFNKRCVDCFDVVTDFFLRRVQCTYLFVLIAALAVAILLVAVGLASGLGTLANCPRDTSHKRADDELALDEGPVLPVYERSKPWTYHRLPRSIVPKHYDIELFPQFYTDDERTFDGNVTIEATVATGTRLIILHALDLNISSTTIAYLPSAQVAQVTADDKQGQIQEAGQQKEAAPAIRRTFFFEPYQYYIIELRQRLKKESNLEIKLSFSGILDSASEGFYKGFFRHPTTGKKLFVAMTQFEPLDARRAFPCFDEPNFKAFFTISVRHKRDFKALSNMPEASSTPDPSNADMVTTRFQRTPVPMATYITAVVVGQYVSLPALKSNVSQLPISVYAPEYALEQTRFALDVSARVFDWMQRFFVVRYPLPKLDFIVLPSFRWTAMENWGLITFREDALLVSNETTEVDRDLVVSVIAHEVAHQWFGNLVTMDWWDDLWLNEGFASYMEFPASIAVGRLVDSEEYYDYLGAIAGDAFKSSRPIRFFEIRSRNDISSAFDSITYLKGSTITRMLVNAMGPEKFKNAIQEYMHTHQYKNARTTDLWASLSKEVATVNISQVMTTWVEQKGVPLITAELGSRDDQLILRQEPLVVPQWQPESQMAETTPVKDTRRWWIPLNVREPSGAIRTEWMPSDKDAFTLSLPGQRADETKINLNQTAFVRVNYPMLMWEKFGDNLAQDINAFQPIDRAGLVDDCLELAKSGLVKYETAFKLIRFLAKETHPLVWETFVRQADYLSQMMFDSPQYLTFKTWLGQTIRSARTMALRNIQPTSSQSSALKNPNYQRILAVLAEASLRLDPGTDAQCYANKYYAGRKWELPANRELRRAIFSAYLQTNDTEAGIAELLDVAKETRLKQVKNHIKYAIARTRHTSLLTRELEKLYTDEGNPTDFLTLAMYAVGDNTHRAFMWDWARENFDKLKPYYGGPTIKFMTWFVNIAKYFNTRTKFNEFDVFARTKVRNFGDGLRARRLVEDRMRLNIFWRDNLRKQLEVYLASLQLPPVTSSTDC